jgi:hypothetical protein
MLYTLLAKVKKTEVSKIYIYSAKMSPRYRVLATMAGRIYKVTMDETALRYGG